MKQQIVIGKIVAPHGVRGDIRILPLTEKPERFLQMEQLQLADGRCLTVLAARFHKRLLLVTTKELTSMDAAERLRGQEIVISPDSLPQLPPGRFYVADLVGVPVYDEAGALLGSFKEVLETGSTDVYVIAAPTGKEILVPALKRYFKEINLAKNRIVVHLPEWTDEA